MREILKMFIVLGIICGVAGALLAGVYTGTMDKIEYQELKFVKGPVIMEVLQGCTNNPVDDRFKLKYGEEEVKFFPGVFNGKCTKMAFETKGSGFGGDIGVIVAVNISEDTISGMGITTHKETPGVGSRAKDSVPFKNSFAGLSINDDIKIKADGGTVDAVSGATVTSKGVCAGVNTGSTIYKELKDQIISKAKEIK